MPCSEFLLAPVHPSPGILTIYKPCFYTMLATGMCIANDNPLMAQIHHPLQCATILPDQFLLVFLDEVEQRRSHGGCASLSPGRLLPSVTSHRSHDPMPPTLLITCHPWLCVNFLYLRSRTHIFAHAFFKQRPQDYCTSIIRPGVQTSWAGTIQKLAASWSMSALRRRLRW